MLSRRRCHSTGRGNIPKKVQTVHRNMVLLLVCAESWQLLSPRSVEGIDPRTGEGFVTRVCGEPRKPLIPYCEERQRRALRERDHEAKDWVSCIPSFQSFARSFVLVARKFFLLSSLSRILRYHATCKCLIVAAWCEKTRVVGSFIEIRAHTKLSQHVTKYRNTFTTLQQHFRNTFATRPKLSQHFEYFRKHFRADRTARQKQKDRYVFDAEQVNLSPGANLLAKHNPIHREQSEPHKDTQHRGQHRHSVDDQRRDKQTQRTCVNTFP